METGGSQAVLIALLVNEVAFDEEEEVFLGFFLSIEAVLLVGAVGVILDIVLSRSLSSLTSGDSAPRWDCPVLDCKASVNWSVNVSDSAISMTSGKLSCSSESTSIMSGMDTRKD